jgi:hypothetical protein
MEQRREFVLLPCRKERTGGSCTGGSGDGSESIGRLPLVVEVNVRNHFRSSILVTCAEAAGGQSSIFSAIEHGALALWITRQCGGSWLVLRGMK